MKKIKLMLMASAVILALGGAFAFNTPSNDGKVLTVYHYDSDSEEETDMQNPALWVDSGPSCDGEGNVPCTISFANRTELEEFLGESNKTEILAASVKRFVTR
jgi:hypothetical protein